MSWENGPSISSMLESIMDQGGGAEGPPRSPSRGQERYSPTADVSDSSSDIEILQEVNQPGNKEEDVSHAKRETGPELGNRVDLQAADKDDKDSRRLDVTFRLVDFRLWDSGDPTPGLEYGVSMTCAKLLEQEEESVALVVLNGERSRSAEKLAVALTRSDRVMRWLESPEEVQVRCDASPEGEARAVAGPGSGGEGSARRCSVPGGTRIVVTNEMTIPVGCRGRVSHVVGVGLPAGPTFHQLTQWCRFLRTLEQQAAVRGGEEVSCDFVLFKHFRGQSRELKRWLEEDGARLVRGIPPDFSYLESGKRKTGVELPFRGRQAAAGPSSALSVAAAGPSSALSVTTTAPQIRPGLARASSWQEQVNQFLDSKEKPEDKEKWSDKVEQFLTKLDKGDDRKRSTRSRSRSRSGSRSRSHRSSDRRSSSRFRRSRSRSPRESPRERRRESRTSSRWSPRRRSKSKDRSSPRDPDLLLPASSSNWEESAVPRVGQQVASFSSSFSVAPDAPAYAAAAMASSSSSSVTATGVPVARVGPMQQALTLPQQQQPQISHENDPSYTAAGVPRWTKKCHINFKLHTGTLYQDDGLPTMAMLSILRRMVVCSLNSWSVSANICSKKTPVTPMVVVVLCTPSPEAVQVKTLLSSSNIFKYFLHL